MQICVYRKNQIITYLKCGFAKLKFEVCQSFLWTRKIRPFLWALKIQSFLWAPKTRLFYGLKKLVSLPLTLPTLPTVLPALPIALPLTLPVWGK